MREIKFRAWNKKRKRMYKVLHLHSNDFEGNWATVEGFDVINQKTIHIQIQPKDIELMQYTGLSDKNGVEIYEGDILSHRRKPLFKVFYENESASFMLSTLDDKEFDNIQLYISDLEVIGNIYENGESK